MGKTKRETGTGFMGINSSFDLSEVLLTDDYYINASNINIEYLISFDVDKLLAGFRDTAGIDTKGVTRYEGWETSLIGGHTLGHYLTACVQGYKGANTSKDQKQKLMRIIEEIVAGLKECQDVVGTGFIFGATIIDRNNIEIQFDNIENNRANIVTQAWVPWYTMHKLIAGLVSVVEVDEGSQALKLVSRLGDWVYNRTSRWSEETIKTVLSIEYGGMNDCLYDLYIMTNDENHGRAAHAFDQIDLFEKVLHSKPGDSVLNDLHANTTIPKFMGGLNRYIAYMDRDEVDVDIFLEYAQVFWDIVVNNHTYITGGNSEWEHFGQDDILDGERTNCNNETCNSYNMLRLTKKLYMLTGNVKYANYYENTFLNSIMSSQNPNTGMTMYFQPMESGYFKVYGEEYDKFWCCVGSGMENFTKLGESFYFYQDNTLIVNQYISSELLWSDKDIKVIQEAKIPESDKAIFKIESLTSDKADIDIAFRLADWLADDPVIKVNNKVYQYETINGYGFVKGSFDNGTRIEIQMPMDVQAHNLADGDSVYGFKYGPVVLSALLGKKDMKETTTGVDVTIPQDKNIGKEYTATGSEDIVVSTDTVDKFIKNINRYMIRDKQEDKLSFNLDGIDGNLRFVTHYLQHEERYGIYWRFISKDQLEGGKDSALKDKTPSIRLDTVQPGYGQYENDKLHNMEEYDKGSTGDTFVGTSRYANEGGAFSYRMIVDLENPTSLQATFKKADKGKSLKISVGDEVIFDHILDSDSDQEEYDVIIPIPAEIIKDKAELVSVRGEELTLVTFVFQGRDGKESARLCNFLYTIV